MTILAFIRKRIRGIISLSSTSIINIAVAVFTLPIILFSIPAADYGKWQFILALQAWAITISAPQITEGSKRGLALGQEGTFFFALMKRGVLMFISAGFFVLLGAYFILTGREEFGFLSFISAIYLFFNILLQESIGYLLIAKKEFIAHGAWDILTSPTARIGSSLVAFFTHNVVFFALFQVCYAAIISSITIFILVKKYALWSQYKQRNYDTACFQFGLRSLPVNIIGAISNRLAEILVGVFFGLSNLAYFSVARDIRNQIANLLKLVLSLFYADFVIQPLENLIKSVKKNMVRMITASAVLGAAGVVFGVGYIMFFLPEEFRPAVVLLMILGLSFPIGIPTTIFNTILQAHLRYRAIAVATLIPNTAEIILIGALGWAWGVTGMTAAIAIFGYISFIFFYLATVKREAFKSLLEQSRFIRSIMDIY